MPNLSIKKISIMVIFHFQHSLFKIQGRTMSMSFTRRRSIDKRAKGEESIASDTLNSTKNSFRPSSSRVLSANNKSYHDCLARIQALLAGELQKASNDKLEQQTAQAIGAFLDLCKGVLMSQRLVGYRQSTLLFTKYIQLLKKQGTQLDESNSALSMNIYRGLIQDLNAVTKDQRNDQLVLEANLTVCLTGLLEILAISVQEDAAKIRQRKPLLMRKNSLKKVAEGGLVRPTSRGKLGSLTKKQRIGSGKTQILQNIKMAKDKKQQNETFINTDQSGSILQSIIFNLSCTLKNICANKKVRRDLLKQPYLRLINRYLLIWNQKNSNQFSNSILVQLTSASRHLAAEEKAYKIFFVSNCFEPWTKLIEMFPTNNDLVFNLLRIISKLSAGSECCNKLYQKKTFLKTLCSFFKLYKNHIHIVIRVAFIFANMTSYISDIRTVIYQQFNAWSDIFECFQHYAHSELHGKSQIDKMGISMAAWDLPAMKKQSDIQALMKIVRLIANLFTVPQIGQKIYRDYSDNYRQLIKNLKMLLQKKSDVQKNNVNFQQISQQLLACVLSCLTNTLYYDREMLLASNEYKTVKKELIELLVDFVVQIDYQQVCCESLRVLSNMTRMKQFIRPVLDAKLHEAVMILLDSTSREIVYYSLGIIINLLADDEFKSNSSKILVTSILEILSQCQNDDFDIVGVALKALSIIVENRSENIQPSQLAEIQNCLVNLGTNCDKVMLDSGQQASKTDIQSAQQSRNLINVLLNNLPEQKYICPVKNCGRKFTEQAKLQQHISRRHKVA